MANTTPTWPEGRNGLTEVSKPTLWASLRESRVAQVLAGVPAALFALEIGISSPADATEDKERRSYEVAAVINKGTSNIVRILPEWWAKPSTVSPEDWGWWEVVVKEWVDTGLARYEDILGEWRFEDLSDFDKADKIRLVAVFDEIIDEEWEASERTTKMRYSLIKSLAWYTIGASDRRMEVIHKKADKFNIDVSAHLAVIEEIWMTQYFKDVKAIALQGADIEALEWRLLFLDSKESDLYKRREAIVVKREEIAALKADYDRQIAELTEAIETVREASRFLRGLIDGEPQDWDDERLGQLWETEGIVEVASKD